jgi:hypothetical protein
LEGKGSWAWLGENKGLYMGRGAPLSCLSTQENVLSVDWTTKYSDLCGCGPALLAGATGSVGTEFPSWGCHSPCCEWGVLSEWSRNTHGSCYRVCAKHGGQVTKESDKKVVAGARRSVTSWRARNCYRTGRMGTQLLPPPNPPTWCGSGHRDSPRWTFNLGGLAMGGGL